jgi:hypothetical protein
MALEATRARVRRRRMNEPLVDRYEKSKEDINVDTF